MKKSGRSARQLDCLEKRLDVLGDLLLEVIAHQDPPTQDKRGKYVQAMRRIRTLAAKVLPTDATVLVASKGDTELLRAVGVRARHFPQTPEGDYAGHHPANSAAAIIHLEALRNRGAKFLLVPSTALWWFDHYPQFHRHLENNYRLLARVEDTCALYDLRSRSSSSSWQSSLAEVLAECRNRLDREPGILDWNTGLNLAAAFPQDSVFSPPETGPVLPYMENSIDLVVVRTSDAAILNEARRVAGAAVIRLQPQAPTTKAFDVNVEWLGHNKAFAFPSVSIIIPTFNGRALLRGCLKALQETVPAELPVEIIVVDDASRDGTVEYLQRWSRREPRLKVVANPENVGFIHSCNRGAAAATGEFLLFLNNDTVPLQGWLAPLLRTFRDYPDAGVVGGKLLFPNGQLQEAGSIVFSDASAAGFGRTDFNSSAPMYSHVREVDYCSGALFATPRALFRELGGFDTQYSPGYYEETDYCFGVREKGFRVYYQPESVVIHLEGSTFGTEVGSATKKYQVINRPKFLRKWQHVLKRHAKPPTDYSPATLHALLCGARKEVHHEI